MINLYKQINKVFDDNFYLTSEIVEILNKNLDFSPEYLAINIYNIQNEIISI